METAFKAVVFLVLIAITLAINAAILFGAVWVVLQALAWYGVV